MSNQLNYTATRLIISRTSELNEAYMDPSNYDPVDFLSKMPLARAMNMRCESIGDGLACIHLPYDARFIGDPLTGVIHGGAISALMDTAAGAAAVSHPKVPAFAATLNLTVDYMRPAKPGVTVVAHAECYHVSRSVVFVRAHATDGEGDAPLASASGAFSIEGSLK